MENEIMKFIERGLKEEISLRYEKLKEELVKELDKEKDRIIASIILHVTKQISAQTMTDRMIIEVRTESFSKK